MKRVSDSVIAMGETPLVTIAIPVYRPDLDVFRRCLESAFSQEGAPGRFEILAVIDGGDENQELLDSGVFDEFPDVRVEVLDHGGEGAARNAIIEHALGKWLVFLDADDYLDPRALEKLVDAGECSAADFVMSDHLRIYPDSYIETRYFDSERTWDGSGCLDALETVLSCGTDQGTVWGKAFRLEFLRANGLKLNTELINGVDQEFMVRCVMAASRISAIPKITYSYVYSSGSVVRRFSDDYPDALLKTLAAVASDIEGLGLGDDCVKLRGIYETYALDRFLMLVINYLCHPEFPGGYGTRKRAFKSAVSTEPYKAALAESDLSGFSSSRQLALKFAKREFFLPIRLIGWLRHRQLARG